eukprot:861807_1
MERKRQLEEEESSDRMEKERKREEERRRAEEEAERKREEERRRAEEEAERKREEERKRAEEEMRQLELERRRAREEEREVERQRRNHLKQSERAMANFMSNYKDVNEVVAMNCKRSRKGGVDRQPFQLWLKTKHMFKDCAKDNTDLISLYTTQIIENVFNGQQHLIQFIIDNASNEQLRQIYDIIKDVSLQCDVHNAKEQKRPNYFKRLSEESVLNILSFLSDKDVNNCKSVCLEFSIIALDEMKKYSLYVLNANDMITDTVKRNKFHNVFHDITSDSFLFDRRRYLPNQLMKHCINQWSIQFDVPSQYALVVPTDTRVSVQSILDTRIDCMKRTKGSYFLFDRRNLIQLNRDTNNTMDWDTDHTLILLHYYDVYKQSMYPIQFLWLSEETEINDILNYVRNGFKPTTKFLTRWYAELKKKMENGKGNELPRFTIYDKGYRRGGHSTFKAMKANHMINLGYNDPHAYASFVFQFDTSSREDIKPHSVETFYHEYIHSLRCKVKCNVNEAIALKWRLQHLVDDRDNIESYLSIKKAHDFDVGKIFLIPKDSKVAEIKNKICSHFNDRIQIVQPKNIQLFSNHDLECFASVMPVSDRDMVKKSITFAIVSYDATHVESFKYHVKLFMPNQCDLPLIKPTHVGTNIIIEYKQTFLCIQFMRDLIQTMQHPLYANQFKSVARICNLYCNKENKTYKINKRPKEDHSDIDEHEPKPEEEVEIVLQIRNKWYSINTSNDTTAQVTSTASARTNIDRARFEHCIHLRSTQIAAASPVQYKNHKRIKPVRTRMQRRDFRREAREREYIKRNFRSFHDTDSSDSDYSSYSTSSDSSYAPTLKERLKTFDKIACTGQLFIQHTSRGGTTYPRTRDVIVKVSFDHRYRPVQISCGSGKYHGDVVLKFNDILYVSWGHYTKVFVQKKHYLNSPACFSVVSKDKVLDLQAHRSNQVDQVELWVKGLRKLLGMTDEKSDKLAKSRMELLLWNTEGNEWDDIDSKTEEMNLKDMKRLKTEELMSRYKYSVIKSDMHRSNVFNDEVEAKYMVNVNVFICAKYLNIKTHESDIEIGVQFVVASEQGILTKVGVGIRCWMNADQTVQDLFDTTKLKQCEKLIVKMEIVDETNKSTKSIKPESYKPKRNDILIATLINKQSNAYKLLFHF